MLKELGDCHAAVADYERARQCYRRAAGLAPDAAGPYVGLGVIAIQTEDLEEARASFEIARKLDPSCSEAYAGLAMILQQRGEYQSSFDMYLASLQLNSDSLIALLGLFQTSCQMGTFAKIIHYLERYLDRHPADTSVLFCLAAIYAKEGMLNQARDALLTVLELEPDKTEANDLLREVRGDLQTNEVQEAGRI
jgi:Flp pilus assembly protein TadD